MLDPGRLTALLVAVSFAAGLNLYVTVAVLGLLGRFHVLNLPPGLSALDHTWVIALAIGLSVLEAVADKIPYFDLVWNAVHTFIRVPAAAILAYQAANTLSPGEHALVTCRGSDCSSGAHGEDLGTRGGFRDARALHQCGAEHRRGRWRGGNYLGRDGASVHRRGDCVGSAVGDRPYDPLADARRPPRVRTTARRVGSLVRINCVGLRNLD